MSKLFRFDHYRERIDANTYPNAREARAMANYRDNTGGAYDVALTELLSGLTEYASEEHGEQDTTHGYYFLFHIGESRAALIRWDWLGFKTLEQFGRVHEVTRTYKELEAEYNSTYCEYDGEDDDASEESEEEDASAERVTC